MRRFTEASDSAFTVETGLARFLLVTVSSIFWDARVPRVLQTFTLEEMFNIL